MRRLSKSSTLLACIVAAALCGEAYLFLCGEHGQHDDADTGHTGAVVRAGHSRHRSALQFPDLPSVAALPPMILPEQCKVPLFILMHAPKTGGTTVLRNLDALCRDHPDVCTFCCHGHKSLGQLGIDAVAESPVGQKSRCQQKLITVRHPVSMVVSSFYESKKWLLNPNGLYARCNHFECHSEVTLDAMLQDNFTIADAINYPSGPFYVRNKVSHFLMDFPLDPDWSGSERFEPYREVLIRRLARTFDFIFDADHLSEGMALWAAYYNVTLMSYDNQWDYNPYKRVAKDSEVFNQIAKQNSMDMILYDEAMRLYQLQKQRLLKAMYPRVPKNFSCSRPQCGLAPPRCVSSCSRTSMWAVPKKRRRTKPTQAGVDSA